MRPSKLLRAIVSTIFLSAFFLVLSLAPGAHTAGAAPAGDCPPPYTPTGCHTQDTSILDPNAGKKDPAPNATGGADASSISLKTDNLTKLSRGLAWYALGTCMVGICVSSALWAMGSKGSNPGQELTGKRGLVLCLTAAFFIGALPGMINWLENQAARSDEAGVTQSGG